MPSPGTDAGHADRIVVGVDGSASSINALDWAIRQAQLTGGSVEVITTWEWPLSYGWAPPVPSGFDPAGESAGMLEKILAPVRDANPDVEIRSTVVEGHPAPVLVDASRAAELLVVGSRGHGEFSGMLIGSVSEHCASNAHCPVVVVRGQH
jgi:nucleotide-binding universal stress UspA family protein